MAKERPILFSGPMVQAILAGRKVQTRRVMKMKPDAKIVPDGSLAEKLSAIEWKGVTYSPEAFMTFCPIGQIGDRLWVRETFGLFKKNPRFKEENQRIIYRADGGWAVPENIRDLLDGGKWKPSIFMNRKYSRITLEIVGVKIERLNDISERDALAEGALYHDGRGVGHSGYRHDPDHGIVYKTAAMSFAALWNQINGANAWAKNPWVWVVEFRKVNP